VFLDDSGLPVRIAGVTLDITDRKQAAEALHESEERFRNMADTAPVMIWVAGPDKLCTFFNKCCLDFTGHSLEQKIGDGWIAGVHPEDRGPFLATYSSSFDARQGFQTVFRLRRADGEYRWVLTTGSPRFTRGGVFAGYIGSCVDITELRRTQEEALARQKLESLGLLAGGIAHDFNNLLGGILAEAELIKGDLPAGSSVGEETENIKVVAIRGSEIVRELMIYAGHEHTHLVEPLDLSEVAEDMLELLRVSISKHVVLKADLDKNLPAIWGNAPQMRQVVMNLVINASEAIGDKQGVIHVTTTHVNGGKNITPNSATELPEGDYVRLEVSDTGCAMTEEAKLKIFDPFFTTKFAGRGLGLAVVQGIVRAHSGAINLLSAPGQGTTFQIVLSCSPKSCLENQRASPFAGTEQSNCPSRKPQTF
jgi:two-component system, cell cycle sensor histidine kinase and response regulator CckA